MYAKWSSTVPDDYYSITVIGGTADKYYAIPGGTVTVTANEASDGEVFFAWQATVDLNPSPLSETATFVMPDRDVEFKADFEAGGKVTVISGTSSGGIADNRFMANDPVHITADAPPSGMEFDKWTSADGVTFTDAYNWKTTFTMPAKNVTVTATYKDLPPATYSATVANDGNGTGSASPASAAAGAQITLSASPNGGYQFKEGVVVSGGVTIADNKFTMPESDVTVKATFEATSEPTYTVTVINGSGSGQYEEGATVSITANQPYEGQWFGGWYSEDEVVFVDDEAESTSFRCRLMM